MKQKNSRRTYDSGRDSKRSRRRNASANVALIAGLIGGIALFAWAMVNPLHLPSTAVYAIVGGDYLLGLVLFVWLLVRTSANQPLDSPTTTPTVHWEGDFQSWNTSLGIRLLATDQQLQVLRRLFDLGNCVDNSVSPPRLDETKRHELLDLIQQSLINPRAATSNNETQVLFSALQYGDRYHVTAILRDLRRLGNPALVPRICNAPVRPTKDASAAPDIHFEEIRASALQCVNVLNALAILHADQDTLLRASSAIASTEQTVLLRAATEVEAREEELLRAVDNRAEYH